jgi:hypothetical protein
MKPSKTDRVVDALRNVKSITVGQIREATGIPAHEVGGILASLERQERVGRLQVEGATRNHWCLLRAEKRSRMAVVSTCGAASAKRLRRIEEQAQQDAANQSGLLLQNIVMQIARNAARRSTSGLEYQG